MINNYTLELADVLAVLNSYAGPSLHVLQWISETRDELIQLAQQNQDISLFTRDRT